MSSLRLATVSDSHSMPGSRPRVILVDSIRGLAIAGVVLFHLVWDLEYAGFISGFAFHPAWLTFGRLLAGAFMFLVGVSLALAHSHGFRAGLFAKRLGVIALAAILISVVSWYIFPQTFIFFGILHAIVAASVIGILFLRLPVPVTGALGVGFLVLPYLFNSDAFNSRYLAWIGLFTIPPSSNDFVPIFPWVGLTLLGISIAKLGLKNDNLAQTLANPKTGSATDVLIWMGRNSLAIYLIHQPLLLAIILPIAGLVG